MPRKTKKPSDAALTSQTSTPPPFDLFGAGGFGGGLLFNGLDCLANGGTCNNPLGFPGYEVPYCESFWTYSWMLEHPVLALARAVSTTPILASTWTFEKFSDDVDEAEEEELATLLSRNLMPLRREIVTHAVTGRDFRRAPMEPVWDVAGGEYRLVDMVPLPAYSTGVYRTIKGQFAGLSAQLAAPSVTIPGTVSPDFVPELPAPYKAWVYIYRDYARQLIGKSWLENVRRTAWKDWLDAAQQLQRLGRKMAGIFCAISGPAGTIPGSQGSDGQPIPYATAAKNAVDNFAAGGHGTYFPKLQIPVAADGSLKLTDGLVELLKSDLIKFQLLDFGNNAPAINGILDRMRHDEELMFMGALMPSRTAQEGQHGTKAEADTHTSTAVVVIENDNDDIAYQLQPIVDDILVLNKGEDYRGLMRCKCPPLEQRKLSAQLDTMKAFLASPVPGAWQEFSETVDLTNELKELDFQIARPFDPENVADAAAAAVPPTMQGDPNAEGDTPPGLAKRMGAANKKTAKKLNGNGNGRN